MEIDSPPAREQFLNAFDSDLWEKAVLQLENSSWMPLMGKDSPPAQEDFLNAFDSEL